MAEYPPLPGSVCAPRGFRAAGVAAGIKPSGNADVALIASDLPAHASAVFTTNRVCAPRGFRAAGVAAGIKPSGNADVALIASDLPAHASAVFTTNRVCAAPVIVSREHLRDGRARAIIVNAGNANAVTGEQGLADA